MKRWAMFIVVVLAVAGGWWWFVERPPEGQRYTVVRGDTLGAIAARYGVTVDQLRSDNGISGDLIEVGQVLTIGGVPPQVAPEQRPSKPQAQSKPTKSTTARLSMPKTKPCLAGPSLDDLDEDGPAMAASQGLDLEQIRPVMRAFLPNLGRCFDGPWPETEVLFEITVACTGRVASVSVLDSGSVSRVDLGCLQDTLRYAGFPAHDVEGGSTFQYPVTFSPG